MPEGNEIHRWARMHREAFVGQRLRVEGPNGRFSDATVVDGRVLREVRAVGKHLGYDFGRDRILHLHMGLYGDFSEGLMPYPEMRGMLRLRMWTRRDWLELRGPTDCSVWTQAQWEELLARLGPDPLGEDTRGSDHPKRMYAGILRRKTPVGLLLMDQSVVSGIGNVYRAELLFRARLSPWRPGAEVSQEALQGIWRDARGLMRQGIDDRRMVTTRVMDRPHRRGAALDEEAHYVYRRHGRPCFVCGSEIMKTDMAGRNLFWCPVCQPE